MIRITTITAMIIAALTISNGFSAPAMEKLVVDRAVLKLAENTGLIIQDRDGFLWFGTNGSGLFRYDGVNLNACKTGPGSISDNYIFALYEDRDGLIWIGTRNGLNAYDKMTNRFIRYRHDPDDMTTISHDVFAWGSRSIWEDSSGRIWVGTMGGLNRLDKKTGRFKRYRHDPDDPESLGHDIVYAGIEDRDGTIWIATFGGGLNRFDKKTDTFTRFVNDPDDEHTLSDNHVMSLIEDRDGTIWVGTQAGGLNRFDKTRGTFTRFIHDPDNPKSISHDNVFSIYEDKAGRLWFGRYDVSPFGLEMFDRKENTFHVFHHDPDDPRSLSSDLIFGVFEDRSGIFWIANLIECIDKIDRANPRFEIFQHHPNDGDSLSANAVVRVYEDKRKNIWASPFGAGIDKLDREKGKWTHYPPDPASPLGMARYVPGIYEDSEGIFWLGNFGGSLSRFDREKGKIIKTYVHDPKDPDSIVAHSQLNHIHEDVFAKDILWLGAYDGGLVKFNKKKESFIRYELTSNQMWMFYQDNRGIIWIPTLGGGLDRFDPGTQTVINYKHRPEDPESISSNSLNYVYEVPRSHILWIGGTNGLDKFHKPSGKVLKRYSKASGYGLEGIMTITGDDRGNLWMGTDSGLVKFNPSTEEIRIYREGDGLPGNKFNFIGVTRSWDKSLWFGTYSGILNFQPEDIKPNAYIPPVVLTALNQGGDPLVKDRAPEKIRHIVLDWRNNFFEFEYAALNYTQPEKCLYQYMLEGHDAQWFYAGTKRFGRYTNLAGGSYTLKIKESNNDGIWNEAPLTLTVTVTSPFWKTGGFYAAMAGAAAMFFVFSLFYLLKLKFEVTERKKNRKSVTPK